MWEKHEDSFWYHSAENYGHKFELFGRIFFIGEAHLIFNKDTEIFRILIYNMHDECAYKLYAIPNLNYKNLACQTA